MFAWIKSQWQLHGTKISGAGVGFVTLLQELYTELADEIPKAERTIFHAVVIVLAFIVIKRGFSNTKS